MLHAATASLRSVVVSSLALVCAALLALPAAAADWPQWRGPERDGRSPETGLLASWPEGGPPLAFRASGLGSGYSSLAVVGDRIYTLGDQGETQYALALSRDDGSLIWKTPVGPAWKDQYGGPRSTPTVDGDRLYVMTTEGGVHCLKAESGEKVWSRSLPEEFGGYMMSIRGTNWKFAESPLVDGERVVVTPGAADAALVALDKATGEEIWRAAVPALGEAGADGAGYSSVVISEAGGVRHYVQLLGRGVVGIEPETGRFLWGYNRVANNVANIPTPLIIGDRVFTSTGYQTGAALLELRRQEKGLAVREVYFLPSAEFQNHHGGMILEEGYVYSGTGHNKGFPIAVKLEDGTPAWGPVRTEGRGSSAVTFADGHLYFRFQDGLMVLVEATPEGYREKGSFQIPEVGNFSWSHPVVAGGRLYLREQDNLFVYDLTGGDGAAGEQVAAGGR